MVKFYQVHHCQVVKYLDTVVQRCLVSARCVRCRDDKLLMVAEKTPKNGVYSEEKA